MNISTYLFPENSVVNTTWWVWTFLLIGWFIWIGGTMALHYIVKPAREEYQVNKKETKWILHLVWVSLVLILGITMIVLGAYSTEFGTTYAEFIDPDSPDWNSIYYTVAWQLGFLIPGTLILFSSSFVTLKVVSAWGERHQYKKIGAPYSFWSFKGFWYQTRHIIYAILTLVMILMGWGFIVNGTGHIFGGIFVRSPV